MKKKVENFINLLDKTFNDETNSMLIEQLKTQLLYLKRDEQDILAYQQNKPSPSIPTRNKRSIEFIGSLFHWSFGLMDANTARQYDETINQLINETTRIKHFSHNQTVSIRETIKLFKKKFSDLEITIQTVKTEHESAFYLLKQKITNNAIFFRATSFIQSLFLEHKHISQQILRSLENAISGKINQLVTTQTLAQDLAYIHKILPVTQMLPIDNHENPLRIFEYSKTDASLFGKRLLLRITIPILERHQYSLYEIIPIPTFIQNKTIIIKPTNRYILMSTKEYIPVLQSEFDNAKSTPNNEKIFTPSEHTYHDVFQNCELNIFRSPKKSTISKLCNVKIIPTMNYFVAINQNNLFFVAISNPIKITETCNNKPLKTYDLMKSGKLSIEGGCTISTDKLSIRSKTNYVTLSKEELILSNYTQEITLEAFAEKIEFSKNITIPHTDNDIVIKNHAEDFDKYIEQADQLVENSQWENKIKEIHYDHINNSNFTFWLIITLVLILLILIAIICGYAYMRFYNIDTWMKLASQILSTHNMTDMAKMLANDSEI